MGERARLCEPAGMDFVRIMQVKDKGIGLLAALCLMWTLLITAGEAVLYGMPGYFEREYTKYAVTERVPIGMDALLGVTDEMMEYLRTDGAELSVFAEIDGQEREFFNEKEKRHMRDVRQLFLDALRLRLLALAIFMVCAAHLLGKGQKDTLLRMLQWGIGGILAALVALALLISTNFTRYFTVFHLLLFDNDDWLLNPKTDLLINIVPEGFFRDTALLIAAVFVGSAALIWLIAAALRKRAGQ